MLKRLLALTLCVIMCVSTLAGCAIESDPNAQKKPENEDKGAYITMYLTSEIYNFDPAYAFYNEDAESIVSLLFTRLFTLDDNGKLQYELAKSYTTSENDKTNEYTMVIKLRETWWSDKTQVTADDVVFAWKRLLDPENSFAAASLLYDVKNARAVKEGDCSIDDLGVYALNNTTLEIAFERPIDYDAFLLNLTSIALAPLRDDYVSKTDDWAKKPGTMVTSGAFKLGKLYINKKEDTKVTYYDSTAKEYDKNLGEYIDKPGEYYEGKYLSFALERNACYYRNPDDPDIKVTKSVTPYRIIVDCSYSDEQLKAAYENGEIHFIGDIPVSLRSDSDFIDDATIKDALSTGSIFLNQDAMIKNKTTGEEVALFADANVRKALSAAIDRVAVAEALVFATPATGIVPTGIFNQGLKGSFRKTGGDLLSDIGDPAALLSAAGVNASDYAFDLIVNPNDDELMVLATKAVEAWSALGFEVTLVKRGTIVNNDYYAPTDSYPYDICDELYIENLTRRDYAAIAIDFCAYNQDAYSMLAPFATLFSGIVDQDMNLDNHYTGYCNESYNDLIEAIFYLPYFDKISSADYLSFANYASAEEFQAVLDACSAIYKQYGVSTSSVDAARSTLLHEAEKMLINDMAIIPVVFNQTATLEGKKVSKITSEWFTDYTDYFTAYNLEKTKFKNYEDHVKHLEQVYAAKTFYVCPSCGHQNEANALSSNHKEYLLTACSKCGAALSTDNIFGQYPFYLRKADAMKAENETK